MHQLLTVTVPAMSTLSATPVSGRCPHCNANGSFMPVGVHDVLVQPSTVAGVRRCPSLACNGFVFVVRRTSEPAALAMFPPETTDFDKQGIPPRVVSLIEEAITCQAVECYTAAGIMVRKTLEVVCDDRGAQGGNLHQRLTSLAGMMVMSADLVEGMKVLKILGNDAAHFESKHFENIGKQEIDVALLLVKEIVKAIYQHRTLVDQLNALKANP